MIFTAASAEAALCTRTRASVGGPRLPLSKLTSPGAHLSPPRLPAKVTQRQGVKVLRISRRPNAMESAEADSGGDVRTVWALDFDGMLCDSVGESALTAWKAALKLWPDVFGSPEAEAKKEEVIEGMRVARPVIETGYENIPMVRAILEGTSPTEMLKRWGAILPDLMAKYGLDRGEMVELFGTTRDNWIKEDLAGWLAPNRFYPGIAEATKVAFDDPNGAMYIVTTKQARFTETLMRDMASIPFPLEKIFSQTVSGRPKSEVLAMLQERHPNAENYLFFEDKMGTLDKMAPMNEMSAWKLLLVDWGYNTEEERARAEASPRIDLIGPQQYAELMRK
eukprot:CAMPEP_0117681762 /NCGR_PEP_ID=MMETSP0804-20121206/19187_1 /TAXON_ID=1074897 /ORGANISM="Tetraselmis astigmatica, Strain CCMP880" /LENGTH=336 /DNA_ID=CAMNT_0005491605 /DNA_START=1 /DNA_END=1011 /DNA_ORIENTATION=+